MNLSQGCVIWLTGLPGSGKSTIAGSLLRHLQTRAINALVLDGDALRTGLNSDLGYSTEARSENLRRTAHVAAMFQEQKFVTIVATISPAQTHRELARRIVGDTFVEVFVNTPIETCVARDPKGLYQLARLGKISDFTGVSSPYEPPVNPNISLRADLLNVDECVEAIVQFIEQRGLVTGSGIEA